MAFIRIGEKLIDREKICKAIDRILDLRVKGNSQEETARRIGIDRAFVSRLESLGEVRRGGRIALIGFPVLNKAELQELCEREALDFVLLMTDKERWDFVKLRSGIDLLNGLMKVISDLKEFDAVIFIGSDLRVSLAESIWGDRVIGVEIGKSPITEDKYVDPARIEKIIRDIRR